MFENSFLNKNDRKLMIDSFVKNYGNDAQFILLFHYLFYNDISDENLRELSF